MLAVKKVRGWSSATNPVALRGRMDAQRDRTGVRRDRTGARRDRTGALPATGRACGATGRVPLSYPDAQPYMANRSEFVQAHP